MTLHLFVSFVWKIICSLEVFAWREEKNQNEFSLKTCNISETNEAETFWKQMKVSKLCINSSYTRFRIDNLAVVCFHTRRLKCGEIYFWPRLVYATE